MSLRSQARRDGRPVDSRIYRRRFLNDIHHLIGRGFQNISHLELQTQDEPSITGLLTASIENFLDDPQSPGWTERYSIQDERHLNDSERQGASRLRVDFELTSSRHRPRPRFQIEAKRLRSPENTSLAAYLGKDGLGSFLQRRYAKGHPWAGMMGYVQSETVTSWANRIRASFLERPDAFLVAEETEVLQPETLDPLLPSVYRSDHLRDDSQSIEIHHVFLHCC